MHQYKSLAAASDTERKGQCVVIACIVLVISALVWNNSSILMRRGARRLISLDAKATPACADHVGVSVDPTKGGMPALPDKKPLVENLWVNYRGNHILDGVGSDACLQPRVVHPGRYPLKGLNQYSLALCYAITSLSPSVLDMVEMRLKDVRKIMDEDVVILLHAREHDSVMKKRLLEIVRGVRGASVLELGLPFRRNDVSKSFLDMQDANLNCCGIDEYLKLHAWSLKYDYVAMLDLDLQIIKPIKHLVSCQKDLLYTSGPTSPLNGGMVVFHTGTKTEDLVQELIASAPTYTNMAGWRGLGNGPCYAKKDGDDALCYGSEGLQGFLHYYFVKRRMNNPMKLDVCVYNSQIRHPMLEQICEGFMPYMLHKGNPSVIERIDEAGNNLKYQKEEKSCSTDFWLLGGFSKDVGQSFGKQLALHPGIEKVLETILTQNSSKGEYNQGSDGNRLMKSHGLWNETASLIGSVSPDMFVNGIKDVVQTCGHKHSKFLVLLQHPILTCYECILDTLPLDARGNNVKAEVSRRVTNHIKAFNSKHSKLSPHWAVGIYPTKFFEYGINCVYDSLYSVHLDRVTYHGSLDNILVVFDEDVEMNQEYVFSQVAEFLSLSMSDTRKAFEMKKDTNKYQGSSVAIYKEGLAALIEEPVLEELHKTFTPFNYLLRQKLGHLPHGWITDEYTPSDRVDID